MLSASLVEFELADVGLVRKAPVVSNVGPCNSRDPIGSNFLNHEIRKKKGGLLKSKRWLETSARSS